MNRKLEHVLRFLFAVLLTVSLTHCGSSKKSNFSDGGAGPAFPDEGDFNDLFDPGAGGPGGPNLGTDIGSGSNGGLSEADQFALKNLVQEQAQVEPEGDGGLSNFLKAEAARLLEEERKGKEVAVQKMILAGKMLTECAKKTAPLAPIPGQPLMGLWTSTDNAKCKVNFTVAASAQPAVYTVKGSTQGTMKATNVGDGVMSTKPFTQGRLTDRPSAGKGTLTHPTFTKTKYGNDPCSTQVGLKTSANPIPKNYQQAIKQLGKCFRQALVLMSPVFDQMFANMNPQLAALIQQRMLGFNVQ